MTLSYDILEKCMTDNMMVFSQNMPERGQEKDNQASANHMLIQYGVKRPKKCKILVLSTSQTKRHDVKLRHFGKMHMTVNDGFFTKYA